MRFFRRVVLNNFGLKLLALAISFTLWATYADQPMAEIGYDVPIAFVNAPADVAIGSDAPTSVHLLIRGSAVLMRRLSPADLTFTVDLKREGAGQTMVPLTPDMVGAPYGASVVSILPTEVRVSRVATSAPTPQAAGGSVLK